MDREGAGETWSSCFCMLAPGMKVLDLITATASLFDITTLSSGGCGVGVRTEEGIWVLLPCVVPCVCNLVSMRLACGCPVCHGAPPLPAAVAQDPVPGGSWKLPGGSRKQDACKTVSAPGGSRKLPGTFLEPPGQRRCPAFPPLPHARQRQVVAERAQHVRQASRAARNERRRDLTHDLIQQVAFALTVFGGRRLSGGGARARKLLTLGALGSSLGSLVTLGLFLLRMQTHIISACYLALTSRHNFYSAAVLVRAQFLLS
jgi:hypothetical protein